MSCIRDDSFLSVANATRGFSGVATAKEENRPNRTQGEAKKRADLRGVKAKRVVETDSFLVRSLHVQVDFGDVSEFRVAVDLVEHPRQKFVPDFSSPVGRQHTKSHDVELFHASQQVQGAASRLKEGF